MNGASGLLVLVSTCRNLIVCGTFRATTRGSICAHVNVNGMHANRPFSPTRPLSSRHASLLTLLNLAAHP